MIIRAQRSNWYHRGIELLAEQHGGSTDGVSNGRIFFGKPIEMREAEENELFANRIEPTAIIEMTEAQILMDDLWNCGIRPSEGTGSAGQLAATQRHLEDMRKLVFVQPPSDPFQRDINNAANNLH